MFYDVICVCVSKLFWYEISIYLCPHFLHNVKKRSSLLHFCFRTFREILMCLSRMISCVYITDDPLIIQSVGHILKRRCIYMHRRFLTSLQKLTGCIQTVDIQKETYSNWTHGSYKVFDGFWFHLCLFASERGQILLPVVRSEHRWSKIQRRGEQKKLTSSNKSKPVPKTRQSISALSSNTHDESTAVPLRSAPHFVATSHSLGQAVGETCRWRIALVAKGRTWTYNSSGSSKQVIVLVANGVKWSEDILGWFALIRNPSDLTQTLRSFEWVKLSCTEFGATFRLKESG